VSVTYSIRCDECKTDAPEIGDFGYIGSPNLDPKRRGSFGYIYQGFEALGILPAELEDFKLFLERHRGHRIRSSPELLRPDEQVGYQESPEGRRKTKPRRIKRGRFAKASYEIKCKPCSAIFTSLDFAPMRPFEPFEISAERIRVFRKHVLSCEDDIYRVGHLLLDPRGELADLDAFLREHEGHSMVARLDKGRKSKIPKVLKGEQELPTRPPPQPVESVDPFDFGTLDKEVQPIIEALQSEDADSKLRAVDELRARKIRAAIPALLQAMRHREPRVRVAALRALEPMADLRTVRALFACLAEPEIEIRLAAVRAFSSFSDAATTRALGVALWDESADVRVEAESVLAARGQSKDEALALCQIPRAEAGSYSMWEYEHVWYLALSDELPQLLSALEDESDALRQAAARRFRPSMGPAAVHALLFLLGDPAPRVRSQAAVSLGRGGKRLPAIAVGALRAALQDRESNVRQEAAGPVRFAGGGVEDFEALLSLLGSSEYWESQAAETALKAMRAPELRQRFCRMMGSADVEKRRAASGALGNYADSRAIKCLISALEDGDSMVRTNSIHSLKRLKAKEAEEPLLQLLEAREHEVDCFEALLAIGGKRTLDAALIAIDSETDFLRYRSAKILLDSKDRRAVETLIAAARGGDAVVAAAAYELIVSYGDPQTEEALLKSMELDLGMDDYRLVNDIARCLLDSENPRLEAKIRRNRYLSRRARHGRPTKVRWGEST
jgi:HEAT repeat protein